jgi:hypothetical protein
VERRWVLAVGLLFLPLSGCLSSEAPLDHVRAANVVYQVGERTVAMRLWGPADVMDRDGIGRPAYILEVQSGSYEGIHGLDLYALDGNLRVVVSQKGYWMSSGECWMGPVADWTSQGAFPPRGILWRHALEREAGSVRVDGVEVDLDIQASTADGRHRLTFPGVEVRSWYEPDSRFTYDASPFPLVVEERASGEWQARWTRIQLEEGAPLAAIDAWPRVHAAMGQASSHVLFPGEDQALLGAASAPADVFAFLLSNSAEARRQAEGGCIAGYSYPFSGGGSSSFGVLDLTLRHHTTDRHGIAILDADQQWHWWSVREENDYLVGQRLEAALTVEGELDWADLPPHTCDEVRQSPAPRLSAQEFLAQAASLLGSGPEMILFDYAVARPSRSDRPATEGWGAYWVGSLPEGHLGGAIYPMEMDAANMWWRYMAIPDGGLRVFPDPFNS